MKILFAILALCAPTPNAEAAELRIRGAAALELWESLFLPEVGVADEHGGPVYAAAKYGKDFGCQKSLDTGAVECWFQQ